MKSQALYILLALLGFTTLRAQVNLVPNGSFEILDSCPQTFSQLNFSKYWFSPSYGTPDLFNVCAGSNQSVISVPDNDLGHQYPYDGAGYCGIGVYIPDDTTSNREYIGIKLSQELIINKYYCFTMYCSLFDAFHDGRILNGYDLSEYTTSNIGVYFSPDSIYYNSWEPLPYVPQIQNPASNPIVGYDDWVKVEGVYKATNKDQYIYIGNFLNNANTVLDTLYANTNPEPWVYFYIDDITLFECDSVVDIDEKPIEQIKIYPNPAKDFVSIELPKNYSQAQLSIYNLTGQLISQMQITQTSQQILITELGNGMYIFVVQNEDRVVGRQRVVVAR